MEQMYKIDELLKKACYIIDILPEQVRPDAGGHFFDVEYYLLNGEKHVFLKDKFLNVFLKLMCYFHISIQWNGWIDRPAPQAVEAAVNTIMKDRSGWLHILLPEENVLVVFDWDSLHLSIYNPPENVQAIMEKIAVSEGLFWRKAAKAE